MRAFLFLLPILSYTVALPEPASAPHSLSSIPTSSSASSFSASPSTFTIPTTTEEQGTAPVITLAPVLPEGGVPEIQEKWHLTTYYTCVTFGPNQVDCGTHEPVLPGGTEIAAATGRPGANARIAVVVAGALVVDALFR